MRGHHVYGRVWRATVDEHAVGHVRLQIFADAYRSKSKLAIFNLAFFSIPRQFAKLNSSPNFPAIRYTVWDCLRTYKNLNLYNVSHVGSVPKLG